MIYITLILNASLCTIGQIPRKSAVNFRLSERHFKRNSLSISVVGVLAKGRHISLSKTRYF